MTSSKRFRVFLVMAVLTLTMTANLYASSADYYLKIEGIKGERARIVKCASGVCKLEGIAPGTFTVTVCDAQGKAITTSGFTLDMTFSPSGIRESPTKASTGATTAASGDVVAPRDVATGQASGKRMHSPIRFTKDIEKSSPLLKVATPTQDCDDVTMWSIEVKVQKIEMK